MWQLFGTDSDQLILRIKPVGFKLINVYNNWIGLKMLFSHQ